MIQLSVIIPFYNSSKYLKKCIDSLLSQTMIDGIEYIFIDDKSSDNSYEILCETIKNYQFRIDHISIIRNEKNIGQSLSRFKGLQKAQGKYILFCDSDDYMRDNMCETLYQSIERTNSDIVYCDYIELRKNNNCTRTNKSKDLISDILYSRVAGSLWNKIIKQELFEGIKWPVSNMGEDLALCIQLVLKANKISYIPRALYIYNQNIESTTFSLKRVQVENRFWGMKESTEVVIQSLKDTEYKYRNEIKFRKLLVKLMLMPLVDTSKWYQVFKETYTELSILDILMLKCPVKLKFEYFATALRLTPFFKQISQ